MGLFRRKPKATAPKPDAVYSYPQTQNYRGFKRIKLSSYGYQPALDGIRALADADLSDATIKISIYEDESPRGMVSVGTHEVGTIWRHSFDQFGALKNGKISALHLEIRDGEPYLFYKI